MIAWLQVCIDKGQILCLGGNNQLRKNQDTMNDHESNRSAESVLGISVDKNLKISQKSHPVMRKANLEQTELLYERLSWKVFQSVQ